MQRTVQQTTTTLTTKKHYNKQAQGTHESAVVGLVGFYMLQVCDHTKRVVVLVALHSCHHFTCY